MLYTQTHEWVAVKEGIGTVGITQHAQCELGEIVYVECPIVGKFVQKGEMIAVLESTKAAVDVYSPISGFVVDSNALLEQQPGLVNTAPEQQGWICRITLTQPQELEALFSEDAYLATQD